MCAQSSTVRILLFAAKYCLLYLKWVSPTLLVEAIVVSWLACYYTMLLQNKDGRIK